MKSLSRLISKDRIAWIDSPTKDEAIRALLDVVARSAGLPQVDEIYDAIQERERLMSTGIGMNLAIPHAKLASVKEFVVGLAIHSRGLAFESLDDKPVHILVMIIGPSHHQEEYLRLLARVTTFLKDKRDRLFSLKTGEEVYGLTIEY